MRRKKNLAPLVFIGPSVLILIALSVVPFMISFGMSVFDYHLSKPFSFDDFVGVKNYLSLFKDDTFVSSILWTLQFALITVVTEVILGMLISLCLHTQKGGKRGAILKTIYILPMMVCSVVAATVWKLMFYPIYGVINTTLNMVGIASVDWLGSTIGLKCAAILIDVWMCTPFCVLVFLAALNTVSSDTIEAARIDGANGFQVFYAIQLPSIRNFAALVVTLRLCDALKSFESIFTLMSRTQFNDKVATLGYYIYRQTFKYFDVGGGAAASIIFFVIIAVVAMILFKITKRKEETY